MDGGNRKEKKKEKIEKLGRNKREGKTEWINKEK